MDYKFFLDVDGVLADFEQAVLDRFGLKNFSNPTEWSFNYEKDFGMSANKFWRSLDTEFWATLPKTPECDLILALLEPYKPTILTSPPLDGEGTCMAGKVRWIRKHLPEYFFDGRYLIGRAKASVARENAVLVDDCGKNCTAWAAEGGTYILVPRPWNSLRDYNLLEMLQRRLIDILGEEY